VTICQECGYDWTGPMPQAVRTVEALAVRVSHMLHETGTLDSDARLRARPADEVWSPLEYIAHSADAIDWYTGRIVRVRTEQRPRLDAYDWDAHTAEQAYHQRRLDDVLRDLGRSCARFTAATTDLGETTQRLEGIGSDGTPRTAAHLVRRAAHEAHHHLRDLEIGLTA
jgi:hypothetical protein